MKPSIKQQTTDQVYGRDIKHLIILNMHIKAIISLIFLIAFLMGQNQIPSIQIELKKGSALNYFKSFNYFPISVVDSIYSEDLPPNIEKSFSKQFLNGKQFEVVKTTSNEQFARYDSNSKWKLLEYKNNEILPRIKKVAEFQLPIDDLLVDTLLIIDPNLSSMIFTFVKDVYTGTFDSTLVGIHCIGGNIEIAGNEGINILIDSNNNNIFDSEEQFHISKPIVINSKKYEANQINVNGSSVYLLLNGYSSNIALAPGFEHPDIEMISLDTNEKAKLSDFKGNIIIMNWWSVNCAPCIMEIPYLNRLSEKYPSIKYFSFNSYDKPDDIYQFLNSNLFKYDPYSVEHNVAQEIGVTSYPRNIIVDRNFNVVYDNTGFGTDTSSITSMIEIIEQELYDR